MDKIYKDRIHNRHLGRLGPKLCHWLAIKLGMPLPAATAWPVGVRVPLGKALSCVGNKGSHISLVILHSFLCCHLTVEPGTEPAAFLPANTAAHDILTDSQVPGLSQSGHSETAARQDLRMRRHKMAAINLH